jgi:cytochrome oxidase Cu insertion factor (SCO1/SenC/PrrC family)/thiol-disulfide isomerase/thioredoxin
MDQWPDQRTTPRRSVRVRLGLGLVAALAVAAVAAAVAGLSGGSSSSPQRGLASNPDLDPGTPLSGPAPDFTLTDQFGRRVSLHSFRGRVVILAFNDSECTTICPLTTTAMVQARRMLGSAAGQVQLLGLDANPRATSIRDVRAYSEAHEMMNDWHFVTGSRPELERVWRAYHIEVAIEHDQIDHTPALFVIDPRGRLAKLYMTQQAYAAVDQLAQILAHEASSLIPGHPRVRSNLSYVHVPGVSPATRVELPAANGGRLSVGGPGRAARLFLFFDTWDAEVMSLAPQLEQLNRYQATAGLPPLTAIDEASVEPSPGALGRFLGGLKQPLSYPVAIDASGRLADGYGVQDQPWLVLISATGRPLWYYDVSTQGWPSLPALARQVRAALARAPKTPSTPQQLAGSPAPLAGLHGQAGRLLGSSAALRARLRALEGYPVVINAWASWCGPCRSEFGLLASAAARYGRQVAFLGADSNDSAGDARAFLGQHPVSYPSYQTTTAQLGALAQVIGLPTTIFVDRRGKVVHVQTGQYQSQGTLDADIATYALRP